MITRQRAWQKKQQALGNCPLCGKKADKFYCLEDQSKINIKARAQRILNNHYISKEIKQKLLVRIKLP